MARYLKFRARLAERWRKKPPKRNGIVQKFHDLIGIPSCFLVESSKMSVFVKEIALLEENSDMLEKVKKELRFFYALFPMLRPNVLHSAEIDVEYRKRFANSLALKRVEDVDTVIRRRDAVEATKKKMDMQDE